jgi:hypothetical protein
VLEEVAAAEEAGQLRPLIERRRLEVAMYDVGSGEDIGVGGGSHGNDESRKHEKRKHEI